MKPYIEVVGESKYLETVEKYVAYINLIVWTNRTKIALKELVDLRNRCIETLKSNGLKHSELQEGGVDVKRNWLNNKKIRQEAFQKIIITCDDMYRLLEALSQLEPLFKHRRYSFTLDMVKPVFSKNSSVIEKAKKEAIANALTNATLLAEGAKLELDKIVEIEELTPIIGAEGVHNHESQSVSTPWDNSRNFKSLENPSREITLRCRVSFSTIPLSDNTTRLNTVDFS